MTTERPTDPADAQERVDRSISRGTTIASATAGGAVLGATFGPVGAALGGVLGLSVGVVPCLPERRSRPRRTTV